MYQPSKTQGEADSTTLNNVSETNTASSSSSAKAPLFLPPCRICNKQASGFHYGVNTCEACKGFYRRTLKRIENGTESPYTCDKQQNCPIEQDKMMCSYCRYKKCLSAGMSKSAIKQGRYTHARKAEYTKEIKGIPTDSLKPEPGDHCLVDTKEMESVLQKLLAVQERVDPDFRKQFENRETFYQKQKEVYEQQCLLPKDESTTQAATTRPDDSSLHNKIELDEKTALYKQLTAGLDQLVRFLVDFVKCIPGFRELSLSDQSSLLKASFLEFGYIGDCCKFDPDMRVMIGLLDMPVEKLMRHGVFPDSKCAEGLMNFSRRMIQLKVSWEEITLIRVILVLSPEVCDLENPTKVSELQWKFVQYLRHVTRHSKNRFAKLMAQLSEARSLQIEKGLPSVRSEPFVTDFPVIQEVISTLSISKP